MGTTILVGTIDNYTRNNDFLLTKQGKSPQKPRHLWRNVMSKATGLNRIIALVAIIATVLLIHFSDLYISEHVNHHCDSSDACPVCAMLEQCVTNLRTISSGLSLAVAVVMAVVAITVAAANYVYQSIQTTLVSQKVRLDS